MAPLGVYNPDHIWERTCLCSGVTLVTHRSPNLRPESDYRYSTARCFYCSVNPLRLKYLYLRPVPPVCWYRLNCNRFNDHGRVIIFSASGTSPVPPAILPFLHFGCCDCTMTLAFHVLRKICRIENIITIYFHIWTQCNPIFGIFRACRGISIRYWSAGGRADIVT